MGLRSKSATQASTPVSAGGAPARTKTSRDERLVRKAMATHDAERERFVEDLKRAVWNGSYDPSGEEIADAILKERRNDRGKDI